MKNGMKLAAMLVAICFGSQNVNAQQLKFSVGDTLFVCAYNGLNMRDSSTRSSKVVLKLDHADRVIVAHIQPVAIQIDNRTSNWLKVEADGYEGFVFGGYLSNIEPMYLDASSFDCNTDMYYLDWVSDVIGDTPIENQKKYDDEAWSANIQTTTFTKYISGDVFYNKIGPNTDSYYFESTSLTYNDVLNFMEYIVACQNRFCGVNPDLGKSIFKPIRNVHGELVRVDCTTPLAITAREQRGKMIVKLETCL